VGYDATPRIEQLAGKLNTKFMVRRELKLLPEILHEDEEVVNLAQGRYEGNEGLIVVTDRRVLFVDQGIVRSHREDFPYEKISSVQSSKGMLAGKVTIFASGNKAVIENVLPKQQADSIADHIRASISVAPSTAVQSSSTPDPQSDPYEKLRKLGDLRDAGVLTEEEFNQKKAALLSEI
jgi:hypothetical protein